MMQQYRELKRRFPDHLLLFRLGDFYELFLEDAELGARLLSITLTSRQGSPMAGIPHHSADGYIARLVQAGQKIAICEQMEAPGKGKKLLKRAVVRVITPGTLTDTAYLSGGANNYLLAVATQGGAIGVALLDVSTGEFVAGEDAEPEAGALAYARSTQGERLGHLVRLGRLTAAECLTLDETAVETLELLRAADGSVRNSLVGVLDETVTPMGARLLRQWLLQPLRDPARIRERQDALGVLVAAPETRAKLRALLRGIGDLERLTSRATLGVAHARDLVALRGGLAPIDGVRAVCAALAAPLVEGARDALADLDDLRALLEAALVDEPPLTLSDGGVIRETWNEALHAIVSDAAEARRWIAGLEERERAKTGLSSLRVRFNRVFGYGIEVSHAQSGRVPADYVRRQTLTGTERYVTPELKDYEGKVLGAEERRRRLEQELFEDVRGRVAARSAPLLATARALALLDVLAALAEVAHVRDHVRPEVDGGDALEIVEGRHPVLEARSGEPVTPNDIALNAETRIVILTGPNMAGKSVYLRQTGLIAILAQMGAWVPARSARIGVVDRVFTRVGAQDNLARGQSTFLVEMVEAASILNHVTPRSLVLLDEVGRGTSTFDGLAIAWAVVEDLHDRIPGAKVLFATHFHELTQLAGRLPAVRNFHVDVREWNDEIVFLHKVRDGGTDRSYGIQVARLAGLPLPVIARAKALLARFEEQGQATADVSDAVQLGLFAPAADPLAAELVALDLAHVTPIE